MYMWDEAKMMGLRLPFFLRIQSHSWACIEYSLGGAQPCSCGVWCCDGIGTGAVVPRGRLAFGGLAAIPILAATRRGDSFPAGLKRAGFRFRLKGRVGSLGF